MKKLLLPILFLYALSNNNTVFSSQSRIKEEINLLQKKRDNHLFWMSIHGILCAVWIKQGLATESKITLLVALVAGNNAFNRYNEISDISDEIEGLKKQLKHLQLQDHEIVIQ